MTNIDLLYPKVCNNIGGDRDIPIDVIPQPKYWGICPRHPRRGWHQWPYQ